MIDMSKFIEAKSDQLNADDLIGAAKTIKVTGVTIKENDQQPVIISYEGDNGKPYKPSKGMRRVLMRGWGRDGSAYIGRMMTLFNNPEVKYGGQDVGGIQISHMSGVPKAFTIALAVSRGKKVNFTVQPLPASNAPEASAELLAAGLRAAEGGVETYTLWLESLNDIEKPSIKYKHAEWSKIAKSVPTDDGEIIL
jgi:hypothetical protein